MDYVASGAVLECVPYCAEALGCWRGNIRFSRSSADWRGKVWRMVITLKSVGAKNAGFILGGCIRFFFQEYLISIVSLKR